MERSKKRSGRTPSLPQDVVEEILSRVVIVKSLMRFRCVSKLWRSIISSNNFIKTHLQNSMKYTIPLSDQELIEEYLKENSPSTPSGENSTNANSIEIVVFIDGLRLLIVDQNLLALVNPYTRKYNVLPWVNSSNNFEFKSLGLGGFDDGDRKILVVLSLHDPITDNIIEHVVKLYSLNSDSWKIVDFKNCDSLENFLGILVNGKLHWGSRRDSTWNIISFDLANEVATTVDQPSYVDNCLAPLVRVIKGCLSVFCLTQEHYTDIWIMKEYGINDSWSKFVRLPNYPQIQHLSITTNLEVLCLYDSRFFLFYNPFTISMRYPRDDIQHMSNICPSLVSPFHS